MADFPTYLSNSDRDIDQALIALKKGTQLIKYSRKGKPKFRAFRLSPDETALIWLSHGHEKNLKLSSVSRILPGQRTPVFRRYLRPEKDCLSFSLIYNNGERSLDLICKDKVEAEVWLACLKALLGRNRDRRTISDISDLTEVGDYNFHGRVSIDLLPRDLDGGSEYANMQLRPSNVDGGIRISVSSTPSTFSTGSGADDIESLGDVYMWGDVWSGGFSPEVPVASPSSRIDVLLPKPLESNVVLDVHQIACGERHVALVTRQGEVFTWGDECGGRLGHGVEKDFSRPRVVEVLAVTNVEFVACGEQHTCAVSSSGDLFTWGDGSHNAGLLGHGSDVSHWIPKRVSGALEGLQVLSIACGSWHSALATSSGKLFTFGDGAFGVLGHGDQESVAFPKEVQLLSGLRTMKVACGVWHTAAIVEVMGQPGASMSSRKLFTWGDGDKYRLGHGNKETYLLPTCISSLIDYNFHQLACGHNMTVALTTSGHVFTMGSTSYGQLGNPSSDGKSPCLVQDRLVGEFVEEISCGDCHVAVLTSRSEVFTWGKGANGRLGHGDTEDRKSPTLVEALKDKHVKSISCGSNFTSSICIHKWVSGADQSVCSGCRQAFGFTKKRHNCYNCGLVHCHSCSSKKATRAALAPTPGKPHRVCDACYVKLKAGDTGNSANMNRKHTATHPRRSSADMTVKMDFVYRPSKVLLSPTTEPVKYLEIKHGRAGTRCDDSSIVRASQVPGLVQLKDVAFPSSLSAIQTALKPTPVSSYQPPPMMITPQQAPASSRSSSPYRRPSPPRSVGGGVSRSVIDSLRKTNEIMKQDMSKLQSQIKTLKQKCDTQDKAIHQLQQAAKEAASFASAESSKLRIAREVVTSITDQLKEVRNQLPPEVEDTEALKAIDAQIESFLSANEPSELPSSLDSDMKNEQANASEPKKAESHNGQINEENSGESDTKIKLDSSSSRKDSQREIIEQFEPGVYVTFVQHPNGMKMFKRVRFSKRKFQEQQAEVWWKENKERLLKRYLPPKSGSSSHHAPTAPTESSSNPTTSVDPPETSDEQAGKSES
ncbi:PH, RCC1 and FYVE domains-containing protein 1 [Linum grandiflorum]